MLLAITVSIVLAALAGARRTDAAVDEFVAADKGADAYAAFSPPEFGGNASPDLQAEEDAIAGYDGVTRTARFGFTIAELGGLSIAGERLSVFSYISLEADGQEMIGRFRVVDGRLPDQGQAGELLIDEELARDADLAVGARVDLRAYTREQLFADASARAEGVQVDAEVVGIVRRPTDLRDAQEPQRQRNDYATHPHVYLTGGVWDAAEGDVATFNSFIPFDVEDGVDLPALLARMTEETGAYAIDHARFLELEGTFKGAGRSASLHSRALQAFAAVVAVAGLFLIGQTLGRQIVLEAHDHPTLRAIGMTARELRHASVLRAAPVAIAGAVLGAAGAIALSPSRRCRGRSRGERSRSPASRSMGRCSSAAPCSERSSPRWPRRSPPPEPSPPPPAIGVGSTDRPSPPGWRLAGSRRRRRSACGSRSSPVAGARRCRSAPPSSPPWPPSPSSSPPPRSRHR